MKFPMPRRRPQPTTPAADHFSAGFQARVDDAFAPDPAALGRIRAQVAAEFRAKASSRPSDARGRSRWLVPLRPAAAFALALGLLAVSVGFAAANSGPGQPFYGLRLAAEELTLPASGAARLDSQLSRLDERLAEARQAAQAGDAGAVAAALEAYRQDLAETLTEARSSGAGVSLILDTLAVQQRVLDELRSTVPASASHGIDQAIDQVSRGTEQLGSGPRSSPTPAGPPTNAGGGSDHSAIPTPERSSHPTAPDRTAGPPATTGPDATPPGLSHRPSHAPGSP
jgi:hypothetical protein